MKDLGYGRDYKYAHAVPEAYIPQDYLPQRLLGRVLYEPGAFGFEKEIAKRLAWWAELRERRDRGTVPGADSGSANRADGGGGGGGGGEGRGGGGGGVGLEQQGEGANAIDGDD
jgi:hypothetical protein